MSEKMNVKVRWLLIPLSVAVVGFFVYLTSQSASEREESVELQTLTWSDPSVSNLVDPTPDEGRIEGSSQEDIESSGEVLFQIELVDSVFGFPIPGRAVSLGPDSLVSLSNEAGILEIRKGHDSHGQRLEAFGYRSAQWNMDLNHPIKGADRVELQPLSSFEVQVVGSVGVGGSAIKGSVRLWPKDSDHSAEILGELDSLGSFSTGLAIASYLEITIGGMVRRYGAYPGEAIVVRIDQDPSTVTFVDNETGDAIVGLRVEIHPVALSHEVHREEVTDESGEIQVAISDEGVNLITNKWQSEGLAVLGSSGGKAVTSGNRKAYLVPSGESMKTIIGVESCAANFRLIDGVSGVPIEGAYSCSKVKGPINGNPGLVYGEALFGVLGSGGEASIPCGKLSLNNPAVYSIIQVEGYEPARVDIKSALISMGNHTEARELVLTPEPWRAIHIEYLDAHPFSGTANITGTLSGEILFEGRLDDLGRTPMLPLGHSGLQIAILRPLSPQKGSGAGSWGGAERVEWTILEPMVLAEGSLSSPIEVTLSWPSPTGLIVVKNVPNKQQQIVAVNVWGVTYKGRRSRSGDIEFEGLPPSHYGVGPKRWADFALNNRAWISPSSPCVVMLGPGQKSELEWQEHWAAEEEVGGQINLAEPDSVSSLQLVPLYEGSRYFGAKDRIPINRSGEYKIHKGLPIPHMIVVEMNGCVVDVILPGESCQIETRTIQILGASIAGSTIKSIGYSVASARKGQGLEIHKNKLRFRLEWGVSLDPELRFVPIGVDEVWIEYVGREARQVFAIGGEPGIPYALDLRVQKPLR